MRILRLCRGPSGARRCLAAACGNWFRPMRLMGTIPERPATPHLSLDLSKLGVIGSASSFFPRDICCLHWFAPPPDSLSGCSAVYGGAGQYDLVLLAGQDETGRQRLPIGTAGVIQGEPPLAGRCRRLSAAEFRSPIGHCGSSSGYCDCAVVGLALYCQRSSSPRLQLATAPSRCTDVVVSNVQTVHATQWTAYSRCVWNKR